MVAHFETVDERVHMAVLKSFEHVNFPCRTVQIPASGRLLSPKKYYLRLHNIVAAPISQDWLGILKIGLDVQKGLEFS